jgi:hypothetical protein
LHGGAVAWIVERAAASQLFLKSSDPDGNRASDLQHAVQDTDGEADFVGAAFVRVKTKRPNFDSYKTTRNMLACFSRRTRALAVPTSVSASACP